ncbi:MAG: hypothetical protein JXQ75_16625 [Phycisphaerae bacterium]|nr:hypothetical protein [Phycisphaerae bacterium]
MRFPTRKTFVLALGASLLSGTVGATLLVGQEPEPSKETTKEATKGITADELAKLAAEMQQEVEALRGWKFKRPVDVGLYTEEQVRAFLQGDHAEESEAWGTYARHNASMEMIGFIPRGCDPRKAFEETMMSFVPGGIYDHNAKAVQVTKKPGVHSGSIEVRVTLAHELTHAMDDQYFGLGKLLEAEDLTSDADHVLGAVFEGSAVIMQERYRNKAKQSGNFDATESDGPDDGAKKEMRALTKAPPHVAVWVARFPCGVRFLFRGDAMAFMAMMTGFRDPGSVADALRTAATHLPRSFEQVLHPEKYWEAEHRDEPVVVNDQDVEALLEGHRLHVIHRDTLGELLCAVLTSPSDKRINPMAMPMPGYWTNTAAAGWGGDRFYLLATGPDQKDAKKKPDNLYGLWLTMWDTADDRDEFVKEYEVHRALESRVVHKLGRLAAVSFFGMDEARGKALAKQLETAPPKFTRDGKPWSFDVTPRSDAQEGTTQAPVPDVHP